MRRPNERLPARRLAPVPAPAARPAQPVGGARGARASERSGRPMRPTCGRRADGCGASAVAQLAVFTLFVYFVRPSVAAALIDIIDWQASPASELIMAPEAHPRRRRAAARGAPSAPLGPPGPFGSARARTGASVGRPAGRRDDNYTPTCSAPLDHRLAALIAAINRRDSRSASPSSLVRSDGLPSALAAPPGAQPA